MQAELPDRIDLDELCCTHLAADGHRTTTVDDDVASGHRVGRAQATAPGGCIVFDLGDQLHLGRIHRLVAPDVDALHVFDLDHLDAGLINRAVVVYVLRLGRQVVT